MYKDDLLKLIKIDLLIVKQKFKENTYSKNIKIKILDKVLERILTAKIANIKCFFSLFYI